MNNHRPKGTAMGHAMIVNKELKKLKKDLKNVMTTMSQVSSVLYMKFSLLKLHIGSNASQVNPVRTKYLIQKRLRNISKPKVLAPQYNPIQM